MAFTVIRNVYGNCLGCCIECPAVRRLIGFGYGVFECACFREFDFTEVDSIAACFAECCCSACYFRCRCFADCRNCEAECCFFEIFTFNGLGCEYSSCILIVCINDYRFRFIGVDDFNGFYCRFQMAFTVIRNVYGNCLRPVIVCPAVCCLTEFGYGVGVCTGFCECDRTEINILASGCA